MNRTPSIEQLAASAYGRGYLLAGAWTALASCTALVSRRWALVLFASSGAVWFAGNHALRLAMAARRPAWPVVRPARPRSVAFLLESLLPTLLILFARDINAELGGDALTLAAVVLGLASATILGLFLGLNESEVARGAAAPFTCFFAYEAVHLEFLWFALLMAFALLVWGALEWRLTVRLRRA